MAFEFLADLALARYLHRRTGKRSATFVWRHSDSTMWAVSSPQCLYRSFRLCRTNDGFHFAKVREWRGLAIISRKVFWHPRSGDFKVIGEGTGFWPPPFDYDVECAKLDRLRSTEGLM